MTIGSPVSDAHRHQGCGRPGTADRRPRRGPLHHRRRQRRPSDADAVSLSDVLPAGFVVLSATTDRGTCDIALGAERRHRDVRHRAPARPVRRQRRRPGPDHDRRPVPAGVAPGTYPNVATASAPSAPPATSPAAPVTVEGLANVSIVKSFPEGSDPDITPGTTETYRIRVVNDGPSVASDVVVTDDLPDGADADGVAGRLGDAARPDTRFASSRPSTCTLGDLPPGTTVELELDVFVDPDLVIDPAVGVDQHGGSHVDDRRPQRWPTTPARSPPPAAPRPTCRSARSPPPSRRSPAMPPRHAWPASTTFRLEIVNFGPSGATGIDVHRHCCRPA